MESSFSPREIVSELDKFIIGQNKAKKGRSQRDTGLDVQGIKRRSD